MPRRISELSKAFISFIQSKKLPDNLIRAFVRIFQNAHPEFKIYEPVIGQEFDNTKMTKIGTSQ